MLGHWYIPLFGDDLPPPGAAWREVVRFTSPVTMQVAFTSPVTMQVAFTSPITQQVLFTSRVDLEDDV